MFSSPDRWVSRLGFWKMIPISRRTAVGSRSRSCPAIVTVPLVLASVVVWEMPQSGERVRGVANNREMNQNYPGLPDVDPQRITGSPDKWVTTPSFTILKITGTGDDYTTESIARYPDGSVWHAVDFFHFRAGKILRQTAYFAPSLEAADWRARWVERF